MTIKEISEKIKDKIRLDFAEKTWGLMPIPEEMINDSYLSVNAFLGGYMSELQANQELFELYKGLRSKWSFENDSIVGQPQEIQDGFIKIFTELWL